jgi:rhomboid protease GluP
MSSDSPSFGSLAGQRYPLVTWTFCILSTVVFIGLAMEPEPYSSEALERWGWCSQEMVRNGALWGFITPCFIHVELWHVAFNLYWIYMLGTRLELAIGWTRYLLFLLAAAFVSSGAEFALSDTNGIGASGVVYAIFGYMWPMRNRYPTFKSVLTGRVSQLFIIWLLGCLLVTLAKVRQVGNAAHFSGLLFGAAVAGASLWPERRTLLRLALAALFLFALVPVVWAPWSCQWASFEGNRAYKRRDFQAAISWYERSLTLGQSKIWCLHNIGLAEYCLGDKAHYQETLELLRGLDKKDAARLQPETQRTP